MRYLVRERGATTALIGHSTGYKDIVQFMKVADDDVRALVRVAVLQAPVSDREAATLEGSAADRAAMSKKQAMIETAAATRSSAAVWFRPALRLALRVAHRPRRPGRCLLVRFYPPSWAKS